MQIKNYVFSVTVIICTFAGAQSESAQFISLTNAYYEKLSADSTFSSAEQIAQIKTLFPQAQESLEFQKRQQKNHAEELRTDDASYPRDGIGGDRLEVQKNLSKAQDILPLQVAIAQAQWFFAPSDITLKQHATNMMMQAQQAQDALRASEERLDADWKSLHKK